MSVSSPTVPISAPTITTTINQNYFIESLGGSQNPVNYLDRFPRSVYNKSFDSLLVKFLYAVLGPVGVGGLRQDYLEARLQLEAAGLATSDLDSLYTNAFAFARAALETYDIDASASLLPASQRAQILARDSRFRNRAIDFLKGARGGGTLKGLTLVAKSGLNRPVELVENWRAMYDHYSDLPLGLPFLGSTRSPNEVIVLPRQTQSQNTIQTLSIFGNPTQGYFTLSYPVAQNWIALPVTTVSGSSLISTTNLNAFPAGAFVTLTNLPTTATVAEIDPTQPGWNHATVFAQSNGVTTNNQVSLVYPISAFGSVAGLPADAPSTGSFIAFVGQGQSALIPWNATATEFQAIVEGIPMIGPGNLSVSGGPLPNSSLVIQFTNQLGDQAVPTLIANLAPDAAPGVTPAGSGMHRQQLSDVTNNPANISIIIDLDTTGISTDTQVVGITPQDDYTMRLALDQTKPLTTFFTTQPSASTTVQQPINSMFTGSVNAEVIRYVTGNSNVNWPSTDSTHWIEPGIEHEGPRALGTGSQHYQGFHNIANILAYTNYALMDPTYSTTTANLLQYWDTLIGLFSNNQQVLVPGLQNYNNPTAQYLPIYAAAEQPEPLIITNVGGQAVINGIYPIDYYSLPGVQPPTKSSMWASSESISGIDYLEIDLGTTQAVNYLYFEASRTPYLIDVAYDTLDQAPARNFVPVTIAPSSVATSVLNLNYANATSSMWETVEIFFGNVSGNLLYTRFLRIGFTKVPVGTPFSPLGQSTIPYSVEVRNLRVGRNVSDPTIGTTNFVSPSDIPTYG